MTRIEIAAMCLARMACWQDDGAIKQSAEMALKHADALLSQLGESVGEHQNYSALPKSPYARPHVPGSATTQPRKVEVTEVESLLSNLIVAINDYNELERLYTLKDDHAFKDAERYINGGDA